ncbi:hypothetical protein EJ08DRAFT_654257 [Tothia fuscella]|uniref:Cyclin-dependent protein kinase regulator pho80 n=1 Tax=Tothia fuscella TaxID=1048955 RepID=A0A9P4NF54_9PEZI|nr:hypothetical protein EJ08DRAFT_654257 [Tothia fuscella]
MRVPQSIRHGGSLLLLLCATLVAAASPSSLTVYAWPLDAASPAPLANVLLSQSTALITGTVESFTPPSTSKDELVRIGLFDSSTKSWNGVATSSKSLASDVKKRIVLHTDQEGNVHHVGFSASIKGAGETEDVVVDVVPMIAGPEPLLNKPVVLNAEGKLEESAKTDEKSFLQKYWWAIALFLLLQVVAGGGGKEE